MVGKPRSKPIAEGGPFSITSPKGAFLHKNQLKQWQGQFGADYTRRNLLDEVSSNQLAKEQLGLTLIEQYRQLLGNIRFNSILEVGCNVGVQLAVLDNLGYPQLVGIEPQAEAIAIGHSRYPKIVFNQGTAFHLPYIDNYFDLVFTAGVLIHIHPDDLDLALQEICRVSNSYIAGFEYYAQKITTVSYRGRDNLLWKMNYLSQYQRLYPELKIVNSMMLEFNKSVYNKSGLYQQNFLLKK